LLCGVFFLFIYLLHAPLQSVILHACVGVVFVIVRGLCLLLCESCACCVGVVFLIVGFMFVIVGVCSLG